MNANEIKFGIEIECLIPRAAWGDRRIGGRHAGIQVRDLPTGWRAEQDCSVTTRRPGMVAVEIVSPILSGADGAAQVKRACEFLKSLGAYVNPSCGLHVTTGFPIEIAALRRLIAATARHENGLYASTGTRNRERSTYCKPIKESFRSFAKVRSVQSLAQNYSASDRYHALNLSHIIGGKERIEYRVFAGTVNVLKILAAVQLCLGIVCRAINDTKPAVWDLEPKNVSRGEGKKAMFCMLRWLKWNKKTSTGIGVIDTETFADVYKLINKLAMKYDGRDGRRLADAELDAQGN